MQTTTGKLQELSILCALEFFFHSKIIFK